MPRQLRVIAGRDCGRVFPLKENQPLLVGRDMGTHTRLKDPHVAMLHCQVIQDGEGALLTDRGSSGGTFVENLRVSEHRLKPGEVFRVGDTRIRFE
jgi:pSer/pThr/pTyr-binding forkhead associated (FHA) protein